MDHVHKRFDGLLQSWSGVIKNQKDFDYLLNKMKKVIIKCVYFYTFIYVHIYFLLNDSKYCNQTYKKFKYL